MNRPQKKHAKKHKGPAASALPANPTPAQLQAQLQSAIALHQQGQHGEALAQYQALLAHQPGHPDCLHLTGHAYLDMGQASAALPWLEKAVAAAPNFPDALRTLARTHTALGNKEAAYKAYHACLQHAPSFTPAWMNLAQLHLSANDTQGAKQVYTEGVRKLQELRSANPTEELAQAQAVLLTELGTTELQHGTPQAAAQALENATALDSRNVFAHNNLAAALHALGETERAEAAARTAIALDKNFAFAHNNLGLVLQKKGDAQGALAAYAQATALNPQFADAHYNMGVVHEGLKAYTDAITAYEAAIALNPTFYKARQSLGHMYQLTGQLAKADTLLTQLCKEVEDMPEAYTVHALVLRSLQQLDRAETAIKKAIALQPHNDDLFNTLGWILHDNGLHEQAEAAFREGLAINPKSQKLHSNLIFLLTYQRDLDHAPLFAEHQRFNTQHAPPTAEVDALPALNSPALEVREEKVLRIGYVSPDFKKHVVRNFIQPVIVAHNPARVHVSCYAQVERPDAATKEFETQCHRWRSTVGLSHAQLAAQIRQDGIDVLIDLAGHSAGNRLGTFMYNPAPVQCTYLGYITTSGLSSIHYRIVDDVIHPSSLPEQCSEQLYPLPRCYKAYQPGKNEPDINPNVRPAGAIVFGSLNRISKLPPKCIALWADVLKALPESKLMLARHELAFPSNRADILKQFEAVGIHKERILLNDTSGYRTHMEIYNEIDIALDPIPVTGGATTAEALWMGVPVLSLAGDAYRKRISATLLSAVGMADWVAHSPETYIKKAVEFANNPALRKQLRTTQRERFTNSELGDGKGLAIALEDAYFNMYARVHA